MTPGERGLLHGDSQARCEVCESVVWLSASRLLGARTLCDACYHLEVEVCASCGEEHEPGNMFEVPGQKGWHCRECCAEYEDPAWRCLPRE